MAKQRQEEKLEGKQQESRDEGAKPAAEDVFKDVALVDPKGSALAALKQLFKRARSLGIERIDSAILTEQLIERMRDETREKLLSELLERQVVKARVAKRRSLEHMDDLVEDVDKGAYPYAHEYDKKLYEDELFGLQVEFLKLQRHVRENGLKVAVIFEGRDAAGKGGTLSHMIEHLNPRGARTVALPKPTDLEKGQWYFQRYVAHLPSPGELVFFDRSWYNRAVVEPVMGFCTPEQTRQFLEEVPFFELCLVRSGIYLVKLWLDVGRKEQKRRFKLRRVDPVRQWKLSPVDIASLDKWDDYSKAIENMFKKTESPAAPWTVIRSDDKRRARLNAMRVVLSGIDYEGKDLSKIGTIDSRIVKSVNEYLHGYQI